MFRVLLVTDQQEVREVFASFEDWTSLGFDRPQMVQTAKEGMLLVDSGVVDAVAYSLSKEEGQGFFSFLAEHPGVRNLEAATDPLRLRRALGALRRALHERAGVDVLTDVLPILQTEFYHSLMEGAPLKRDDLYTRIAALQMQVAIDSPVCVAHLQLPQGEEYVEEVWRYGRNRLENALRTFFERDLQDMRFVLNVMSAREIKLLGCPKKPLTADDLCTRTQMRLAQGREETLEYLELEVQVQTLLLYDNLPALCAGVQAIPVAGA